MLCDSELGVISSVDEIGAVGHRVAHGGEKLRGSSVIGDAETQYLESIVEINPLHGPPAISGIKACKSVMPNVKHVGVFDTSYYSTVEEKAYIYPIPYELYEKYKIRRYGFHGTSHRFVCAKAMEMLGNKDARVITCHLGNGSSITASVGGKAVDTSMGFTPQEGVPMGTRSGSVRRPSHAGRLWLQGQPRGTEGRRRPDHRHPPRPACHPHPRAPRRHGRLSVAARQR